MLFGESDASLPVPPTGLTMSWLLTDTGLRMQWTIQPPIEEVVFDVIEPAFEAALAA
jgi:hypothetical protein